MTTFAEKSEAHRKENSENIVLCPVCGNPVNNHAAEELYTVDVVESDFRVRTLDDDILDNWLVFCHHCYYITHDFTLIPERINELREIVESPEYLQRFSDVNPTTLELFENYLFLLEEAEASPMVFADTYLRMSWLFDDDRDRAQAEKLREKAIKYFAKSLLLDNPDEKERSLIYYYIAELSRRNEEFDRAKKALLKMDMSIGMFRRLYEFQSELIRERNANAALMPREDA
jgi:tetratricopeptide (TPR) repeat protein